MIIVTGGAGFIGSNLIRGLNNSGRDDIAVVDDLTDGHKFRNLVDCHIADYLDKDEFLQLLKADALPYANVSQVFHQGACSTTTEWNGRFMLENNYSYSKLLLQYCARRGIPFIYASSAAVYGAGTEFIENRVCEHPVNVYGYSKFLFDEYVRRQQIASQVVGLRYFNVYGPGEQHKGTMASVAWHLNNQIKETGRVRLFKGSGGYADGEQRRDFIHVDDVVAVNVWFMQNTGKSGIFNVGTGQSRSFNDVAGQIIHWHGKGAIDYIDFPEKLQQAYQSFTEADISELRKAGYNSKFLTLEQGMKRYLDWLNSTSGVKITEP